MTGEDHAAAANTAIGAMAGTAGKLINSLPAQFMVLVLLNTAFLSGLLWFLNKQEATRERIYGPVLAGCMNQIPMPVVQELLRTLHVGER
jgi:hypothetical protein